MFGVKVVPIDVINHPLQYGGKKLGHPVYLKTFWEIAWFLTPRDYKFFPIHFYSERSEPG